MSARNSIRNGAALAHVAVCKSLGQVVSFAHRGAAAITGLHAMPNREDCGQEDILEVTSEVTQKVWSIARQASFPPTGGPSRNDVITDASGIRWRVITFGVDSLGAVWSFECERTLATELS